MKARWVFRRVNNGRLKKSEILTLPNLPESPLPIYITGTNCVKPLKKPGSQSSFQSNLPSTVSTPIPDRYHPRWSPKKLRQRLQVEEYEQQALEKQFNRWTGLTEEQNEFLFDSFKKENPRNENNDEFPIVNNSCLKNGTLAEFLDRCLEASLTSKVEKENPYFVKYGLFMPSADIEETSNYDELHAQTLTQIHKVARELETWMDNFDQNIGLLDQDNHAVVGMINTAPLVSLQNNSSNLDALNALTPSLLLHSEISPRLAVKVERNMGISVKKSDVTLYTHVEKQPVPCHFGLEKIRERKVYEKREGKEFKTNASQYVNQFPFDKQNSGNKQTKQKIKQLLRKFGDLKPKSSGGESITEGGSANARRLLPSVSRSSIIYHNKDEVLQVESSSSPTPKESLNSVK